MFLTARVGNRWLNVLERVYCTGHVCAAVSQHKDEKFPAYMVVLVQEHGGWRTDVQASSFLLELPHSAG